MSDNNDMPTNSTNVGKVEDNKFISLITEPQVVGYFVFGVLSIIAIYYIVKYSIEIDKENYNKQMSANNKRYNKNSSSSINLPQPPPKSNTRFSVPGSEHSSTMFTSGSRDYYNQGPFNTNTSSDMFRNTTLNSNQNSLQGTVSSGSYQQPSTLGNRQSRQFLLQNF